MLADLVALGGEVFIVVFIASAVIETCRVVRSFY